MKKTAALLFLATSILLSQKDARTIAFPGDGKWEKEANGSESVTLREDSRTGALELLVRYPGGHAFPTHWHTANERIVLLEGRLSVESGDVKTTLEPGGYAFLPAKQAQKLACVSQSRCAFYVHWDGKLDFHKAGE